MIQCNKRVDVNKAAKIPNARICRFTKGQNQEHIICVWRFQTENHATARGNTDLTPLNRAASTRRAQHTASANDSHLFCWASSWMLGKNAQNVGSCWCGNAGPRQVESVFFSHTHTRVTSEKQLQNQSICSLGCHEGNARVDKHPFTCCSSKLSLSISLSVLNDRL